MNTERFSGIAKQIPSFQNSNFVCVYAKTSKLMRQSLEVNWIFLNGQLGYLDELKRKLVWNIFNTFLDQESSLGSKLDCYISIC